MEQIVEEMYFIVEEVHLIIKFYSNSHNAVNLSFVAAEFQGYKVMCRGPRSSCWTCGSSGTRPNGISKAVIISRPCHAHTQVYKECVLDTIRVFDV